MIGIKSAEVSVEDLTRAQSHLSYNQQQDLQQMLECHGQLFSGRLETYPHPRFHIELKPDAVPFHGCGLYAVAHHNLSTLKEELDHQYKAGVLEQVYETEWGMPMLAIPKKDGSICTINYFRKLNKPVVQKQYPLPRIQDIFQWRQGYAFFTKLNLVQCYYTYMLDEPSSRLCILVTPFGQCCRLRLPMGLTQSHHWAQGALEEVLKDLLHICVECFIDDLGIFFFHSWEDHVKHVRRSSTDYSKLDTQ